MSNMSFDDQMMLYLEFRIHKQLELYVPPLLLIIGTLGNVLSFCVLMRRSMRVTSTYNYLAVLALLDTLVLYVGLLKRWLTHLSIAVNIANQSDWSCKLVTMIVYTVTVSSVWLLIAVTVDRYIATVHGIHAMTMCTQRRAVKIIASILVLFTIVHLHFLFTMELAKSQNQYVCRSMVKYDYLVEQIWPWIDGFLYCFAPFAIIATLNTLIIAQVVKSKRTHQQASRHLGNGDLKPLTSRSTIENSLHVTIMLLVISFTFLLCTFPMAVVMIRKAQLLSRDSYTLQEVASHLLAKTISELLLYTNHSINFYLYLLSGHRFRQEMCIMIRCCCCCQSVRSQTSPKCSTTFRKHSEVTTTMVTFRKYSEPINATAL